MHRGLPFCLVAMLAVALPAHASAATLTLPAPDLGDLSVAAVSVRSSTAPKLRVTRAGGADLVVSAVGRARGGYSVIAAAFNRPPAGSSTASTIVQVSPSRARVGTPVSGGSVLSDPPVGCPSAFFFSFSGAYRGTFATLTGTIPSLPSGTRPALLVKYAFSELCGSSYEQHDWLRHFAWNVAPNAPLPVTSSLTVPSWPAGATSGSVCVQVVTNPPQPGAAVTATIAPQRGSSYSGSGTIGANGDALVPVQVGKPGDYDVQITLNGTAVSAGFAVDLPGPTGGAFSC